MDEQQTIEYTREGGRYYRAKIFFYTSIVLCVIPVVLLIIIGILNPLWFREDMLCWIQNTVERITDWRNYKMRHLYLGMDPKVWSALNQKG